MRVTSLFYLRRRRADGLAVFNERLAPLALVGVAVCVAGVQRSLVAQLNSCRQWRFCTECRFHLAPDLNHAVTRVVGDVIPGKLTPLRDIAHQLDLMRKAERKQIFTQ
jgi:hypothetical protein